MDETTTAPILPADTPAAPAPSEGAKTLTQEQLNALFSERAAQATRAAQAKLLSDLGVESVDAAKAALAAHRQAEDAKKTDLERLQGEIAAAKAAADAAQREAQEARAALSTTRRTTAFAQAAAPAGLIDPDVARLLLEADGTFAALYDEADALKPDALTAALDKLKAAKPFLFAAPPQAAPAKPDRGNYAGVPSSKTAAPQTGDDSAARALAEMASRFNVPLSKLQKG